MTFRTPRTDATSGVATTSEASPLVFAGAGANLTKSVVVTDAAGNSATFTSPAVYIDRSPPVVQAQLSGTLGSNGWYISEVELAWSESETRANHSREGCFEGTLRGGRCRRHLHLHGVVGVGGSTTETVIVKRDATPPVLYFEPPTPCANAAGWYNGDVSFPFDAADCHSGVASTSSNSPVVIMGEGAGLEHAGGGHGQRGQ